MSNIYPLVSCIMPTANREKFIPLAINYFQKQNYPNKELIILDDGKNAIEGLLPEDAAIRYRRLHKPLLTGSKRNQACDFSNGEIIVHWDDDDWYAPNWISHQVKTLQLTNADITGLSQLFFYSPLQHKCWKYIYPPYDRLWVAGATMGYVKKFWEKYPFQDVRIGEDNKFVWNNMAKVAVHAYMEGFVSIIHTQNTSPKNTNNPRWKPAAINLIEDIVKEDLSLYTVDFIKRKE